MSVQSGGPELKSAALLEQLLVRLRDALDAVDLGLGCALLLLNRCLGFG